MEIVVINKEGQETGRKVQLSENIFGIEPNDHAIYLDVKRILAAKRQGTHKSKDRSEISGSTRKLKRQKGTGTARFGDIKNPVFRGGGRIFGPDPRDYTIKLNKKVKDLARKSALAYKAKDLAIKVVEDFTFETPNTKQYIGVLSAIGVESQKSLVVTAELDKAVFLSSRNIKKSKVAPATEITTFDVLNADTLVVSERALASLEEIFNKA